MVLPLLVALSLRYWTSRLTTTPCVKTDSITHGTILYCNTTTGRKYLIIKYSHGWDLYHGGVMYDDVKDWNAKRLRECEEDLALPPESISFVNDTEYPVSYVMGQAPTTRTSYVTYKIAHVDTHYWKLACPDGADMKQVESVSYDQAMRRLSHPSSQQFLTKVDNMFKRSSTPSSSPRSSFSLKRSTPSSSPRRSFSLKRSSTPSPSPRPSFSLKRSSTPSPSPRFSL